MIEVLINASSFFSFFHCQFSFCASLCYCWYAFVSVIVNSVTILFCSNFTSTLHFLYYKSYSKFFCTHLISNAIYEFNATRQTYRQQHVHTLCAIYIVHHSIRQPNWKLQARKLRRNFKIRMNKMKDENNKQTCCFSLYQSQPMSEILLQSSSKM